MTTEEKLEIAVEALEFYKIRKYYPSGGMPFFPEIDRNEQTQKRAKEALEKINDNK